MGMSKAMEILRRGILCIPDPSEVKCKEVQTLLFVLFPLMITNSTTSAEKIPSVVAKEAIERYFERI